MMTQSHQNELVALPALRTGAISLLAIALLAIAGGYLSLQRGGQMNDGVNTLIATIPGVLIPSGILVSLSPRIAGAWSIPVLAMTMLRALIVLGIGMGVYALIEPNKTVFFLTLLASLLITLIIDVACVLSLISKHSPASMSLPGESEGVC